MAVITILLSTYNGEKYLNNQLESIYKQILPDRDSIQLFVRDDGSSDGTIGVLESWKDRLRIDYVVADNIGARDSFFWLIMNAPLSDYYAFCDQDDVWNMDKIFVSLESIKKLSNVLFFSNIAIADSEGNDSGVRLLSEDFELSLKRIIMCNPANGCSMVWDCELMNQLRRVDYSAFTMHDEFVCTIAYLVGTVVYEKKPTMMYRIHASNVTQSNDIRKKIFISKSIWFERKDYSLDKRASELLKLNISTENKMLLKSLKNYKKGINRLIIPFGYTCENKKIERSFKMRMMLGII